MNKLLRHVVLLLLSIHGAIGDTASSASHQESTISTTSPTFTTAAATAAASLRESTTTAARLPSLNGNGTCSSRTINYITQTLPRQCLRTDRVPLNSTLTTLAFVSDEATAATVAPDSSEWIESLPNGSDFVASNPSVPSTFSKEPTPTFSAAQTSSSAAIAYVSENGSTQKPLQEVSDEGADSPLDNANFLSFEDWKKQNLAKTGQSPDDIGRSQPVDPDRSRPVINNALDSLGEESEIDLDFSGFGGPSRASPSESPISRAPDSDALPQGQYSGNSIFRSKDAGKTCKERTNYASFDCSATMLKTNKECKSASSVLVENKDSYMLNTCSAENKFLIVQLCNDIQIDTIVLANYEFFSSSFRHFRVSVSDRYPVKLEKWKDLGTFEAKNTREIQAFLVENPIIWAKYLRIEFLSHYGTEYYCPVSLLRVHGTTMIEDYRHQEHLALGEEDATLEAAVIATPPVAQDSLEATVDIAKTAEKSVPTNDQIEDQESLTVSGPLKTPISTLRNGEADGQSSPVSQGPSEGIDSHGSSTTELVSNATTGESIPISVSTFTGTSNDTEPTTRAHVDGETPSQPDGKNAQNERDGVTQEQRSTQSPTTSSSHLTVAGSVTLPQLETQGVASNSSLLATDSTISTGNATSVAPSAVSSLSTMATANSTKSASPLPPQPSSQESFFKSFAKRLHQLESNSTLSLQYIEEQSRILREAFSKVEKRQVTTTSRFLTQLNETVMVELHGFRQAYDQLWQSTVIELDGQREAYQREMLALSSRLTMVADELVWQKRMGIVQSTLLLLCLGLVLFGRGGNGYLEVPLMQQMINRSKRYGWDYSPPHSASPDSRSPVSLFRRKLWRAKSEPLADSGNITDSDASAGISKDERPNVVIEPPSPEFQSDNDEPADGDSSVNNEGKDEGLSKDRRSPKKHRMKAKKPPHWPQINGMPGRHRSPLAT